MGKKSTTIDKCFKQDWILAYDLKKKLPTQARILDIFDNGEKPVYLFVFQSGRKIVELRCTEDHRILDSDGQLVPVREFKINEFRGLRYYEGIHHAMRLVSKDFIGYQKTFDLLIDHPDHIYSLDNGILVENSGKTTAGAIEAIWHMTGLHPHRKISVPNRGRIIANGFISGIDNVVIPKLMEWMPKNSIAKTRRNQNNVLVGISLKNGSHVDLMSQDQEVVAFEGGTYDWVWYDEPAEREKYIATKRGLLRSNGSEWITMTPLTEPWIYDEIYLRADDKRLSIENFIVDIMDNCTTNGGYLTPESIIRFEESLPESEKETRLHGKFKALFGRVYSEFSLERHVIETRKWLKGNPVWVGIDIHMRKPNAAVYVGIDKDDVLYVIDEIYEGCTIPDFIKLLLEKENYYDVKVRVIDTIAGGEGWGSVSAKDMMDKAGLRCIWAQKRDNKMAGISKIQSLLQSRPLPNNPVISSPSLFVFNNCVRTIKEFNRYVWDNFKKPEQKGTKEEPKKIFDDILDALRYVVLAGPRYNYCPRIIDLPLPTSYGYKNNLWPSRIKSESEELIESLL